MVSMEHKEIITIIIIIIIIIIITIAIIIFTNWLDKGRVKEKLDALIDQKHVIQNGGN